MTILSLSIILIVLLVLVLINGRHDRVWAVRPVRNRKRRK